MNVGFIGAGNMGGALASAISKDLNTNIYIYDKDLEKAGELAVKINASVTSPYEVVKNSKFLFLGVKPAVIRSALSDIIEDIREKTNIVVVSMAAGVSIRSLEDILGDDVAIIRIMPNTPVTYGNGMVAWCANGALSAADAELFRAVMGQTGALDRIDESMIDAESAIAGCGPAFVYMFAEALADGGVQCGLPRDKAIMYAAKTLSGAADMLMKSGKHPERLKDEVCSPGGSTIEGVHALEEGKFRAAVSNAVIRAYEKTKKLGK